MLHLLSTGVVQILVQLEGTQCFQTSHYSIEPLSFTIIRLPRGKTGSTSLALSSSCTSHQGSFLVTVKLKLDTTALVPGLSDK